MIYFVRWYFFGLARWMLICQGLWPAAMISPLFFQLTHEKKISPRRKKDSKGNYIF